MDNILLVLITIFLICYCIIPKRNSSIYTKEGVGDPWEMKIQELNEETEKVLESTQRLQEAAVEEKAKREQIRSILAEERAKLEQQTIQNNRRESRREIQQKRNITRNYEMGYTNEEERLKAIETRFDEIFPLIKEQQKKVRYKFENFKTDYKNINIYKQETMENAIRSLEYLNKEVCYWVSKIPCNEFIDKYPIVQRSEQWNINDYPNDYA